MREDLTERNLKRYVYFLKSGFCHQLWSNLPSTQYQVVLNASYIISVLYSRENNDRSFYSKSVHFCSTDDVG